MLLDVDKSATTLHSSKALTILRTFINRVRLKTRKCPNPNLLPVSKGQEILMEMFS